MATAPVAPPGGAGLPPSEPASGPASGRADLALFDFDGTITVREMFPDFLRFAVAPRRLAIGKVLFAPLVLAYRLGLVSGTKVRAALVRFGFAGTPLAELEVRGRAFARRALAGAVRPQVLARIAWHQARGDRVVVVSGGLDVYLRHWCREHRLELICSALEHQGGVLTGRYLGRQCVGEEKPRRVRESCDLPMYARIHAYGDTVEDLPMLAMAHERQYRGRPLPGAPR